MRTAGNKPQLKVDAYLQEGSLYPQYLHGICISEDFQGVRCFGDSFNLLVDLDQDLTEEAVFDVVGEKRSERTLLGWPQTQCMLNLLNKSARQTG